MSTFYTNNIAADNNNHKISSAEKITQSVHVAREKAQPLHTDRHRNYKTHRRRSPDSPKSAAPQFCSPSQRCVKIGIRMCAAPRHVSSPVAAAVRGRRGRVSPHVFEKIRCRRCGIAPPPRRRPHTHRPAACSPSSADGTRPSCWSSGRRRRGAPHRTSARERLPQEAARRRRSPPLAPPLARVTHLG